MILARALRLFLSLALFVPSVLFAADKLNYVAYYQGAFSFGQEIQIAEVGLESLPLGSGLAESRLSVSSQRFDFVEDRYPFRYLFRSLIEGSSARTLAMDTLKQTNKSKRETYWVDIASSQVLRLGSVPNSDQKPVLMPVTIRNWVDQDGLKLWHKISFAKNLKLVDRLTMLHGIRLHEFQPGETVRFKVTTGKEIQDYSARVEKETELTFADGSKHPAWKIRIDGVSRKSGHPEPAHAPVYLWLEKNSGIPLKFEHKHQIGDFRVLLTDLVPTSDS